MQAYEAAGSRRFDIDYDTHRGFRYETAGAFLAGIDTAGMTSSLTRELTGRALDSVLGMPRLTARFAEGEARRELVLAYRAELSLE